MEWHFQKPDRLGRAGAWLPRLVIGISGLGFVAALVVYLAPFFGVKLPSSWIVSVLLLLLPLIWLPTILLLGVLSEGRRPGDGHHYQFRGCPPWMRTALVGVCLFGFVHFGMGRLAMDSRGVRWTLFSTENPLWVSRIFAGGLLTFYGGLIRHVLLRPESSGTMTTVRSIRARRLFHKLPLGFSVSRGYVEHLRRPIHQNDRISSTSNRGGHSR